MAQGRFVSRTVATDPQLSRLSLAAELLYLKSIPFLDRDGICTGEPLALLGMISPFRFSELHMQIADIVDEWVDVELVIRYETPVGLALWFKGFSKQQKIYYDRESASQYPPPPGYIRTDKGLTVKSIDVPWIADSRFSAENRDLQAQNRDSAPQAESESEAEQQSESEEQQQQQQQGPAIAAAAAVDECLQELEAYGISGQTLTRLSTSCSLANVRAWIAYADTQPNLTNRQGYVIKQLLSGASPPRVVEEDDDDSYAVLKRKYIPSGWEDIVKF